MSSIISMQYLIGYLIVIAFSHTMVEISDNCVLIKLNMKMVKWNGKVLCVVFSEWNHLCFRISALNKSMLSNSFNDVILQKCWHAKTFKRTLNRYIKIQSL